MKKVKVSYLGYPGWHIECSAMSSEYLGEQFDIHTGGLEHIPVHHTNEIAQAESVFGKKPWVKYWMHTGWLLFKGKKVSKSKGGLYTISELEKKDYEALAFRYLTLTTHYRKPLNFSLEILENAQNSFERLKNIISELKEDKKTNKKYLKEFEKTINDDLNMPEALQVVWKMIRDEKAEGKIDTIKKMDEVLGLDLLKIEDVEVPTDILEIIKEREQARKNKNWKKADALREVLKKEGYNIDDTPEGPKARLVKNGD